MTASGHGDSGGRADPPANRRFRRRTIRIDVSYTAGGRRRDELATTLGAGGLFIQTERALPIQTPLVVRFRLPGGQQLHEIDASVAWVDARRGRARRGGMGIRFSDAGSIAKLARELEQLPD